MYRWAAYGAGGTLLAFYGAQAPWLQSYFAPMAPNFFTQTMNSMRPSLFANTSVYKSSVASTMREMAVNTTFNEASTSAFSQYTKSGKRKRIVAIGDLHGDLAQMKKVFHLMGIIDTNDNWAGGDHTTFVQTVRPLFESK